MRRAIAVSAFGLGRTSPNPPVGCVVLDRGGAVAGQGYHLRKGDPHAEANALVAAGARAGGGTAVVTLEPCNHHGRTPPCRQALLDAGIARVLIAVMDPTSRGDGGAAVLRDAGVDVETGVLEAEALSVLGSWLAATTAGRPVLTWTYLLDGADVHELPGQRLAREAVRLAADAVLAGGGELREAVRGSHGPGILQLPAAADLAVPAATLQALHTGGVRSLLVSGSAGEAFAAAGLVDRVIAYLAPVPPSAPGPERPITFPPGLHAVSVARDADMVRVVAEAPPTGLGV
uniref:bifunctional diaminohydroxyphosphoribosylaminopyrimidine deaminase/5-amino-6-(5-phosphoribosylamino)uracil reductase RibD n=1 Tax=Actinomadura sp. CA-154981 TaxID=3240037 RepID=UPI003F49880A